MNLDKIIADYESYHQDPVNIRIHLICVPLIMLSVLGVLNALPLSLAGLGLGHFVAAVFFVYYLIFARKYLLPLAVLFGLIIVADALLATLPLRYYVGINIVIFVVSWFFQFWGHRHEGNKPAFIDNKETGFHSTFMAPILVVRHAKDLVG